jgi:hypothetical protein
LWLFQAFNHLTSELLYLMSISHTHRLGSGKDSLGNLGAIDW